MNERDTLMFLSGVVFGALGAIGLILVTMIAFVDAFIESVIKWLDKHQNIKITYSEALK